LEFKNIEFGEMSAEEEADKNENLIIEAFYHFKESYEKIYNGDHFLVLGNKGSGKSIIGEHLKATAGLQKSGIQSFVKKQSMKEFPFKSFSKIIPGGDDVDNKLSSAWQWALLAESILSFAQDEAVNENRDNTLHECIENLKQLGILPSSSLTDVARISSDKSFKVKLMQFEYESERPRDEGTALLFTNAIGSLKKVVEKLHSPNKHFIVIDGLDDQISSKVHKHIAISSLINESSDLNKHFRRHNVPIKIVILCRTDIYKKLPGANKNKNRSYAIDLNWYEDQTEHSSKNIIELAKFRAQKSGAGREIFDNHFLETYHEKPCMEYLLEYTRYTPRDFLMLLKKIQDEKIKNKKITADQIATAIKRYSTDYFWPEIEDELDGYHERSEIEEIKNALKSFQSREFSIDDFANFCTKENYKITSHESIFKTMYDCGAISNKSIDGTKFFSKMRDGNDFDRRLRISIHRASYKSLGL
jgi:energy-coupling factor transporter ATP-binding protein EcfA2